MPDEPDNVVDLYPRQEESLISRAIDAMGRAFARKRAAEHNSSAGGVIFIDDDGNEVGYLVPIDPTEEE